MIKAVIFDYNGTLYDDLNVAYGSVVAIFNTYNIPPPTLEQYRQEITADFMKFYYGYGFSQEVGNPRYATANDLNAIRKQYYKDNFHKARFRPDAEDVLKKLKSRGVIIGIVSAEIDSVLRDRLSQAGLINYFGDNIKAGVYGDKRPALFQMALDLNIPPQQIAYVDDTVDGTGAAKFVGMKPVAMVEGYNSHERLSTVTTRWARSLMDIFWYL